MEIQSLRIGRPLEISVTRDNFIYHFVSTIEAVKDRTVCVTLITGKSGQLFRFYPDDRVTFIYRMDDRLWQWKNVVGGMASLDDDRVHTLTVKTAEGTSYNRREAYRVFFGEETDFKRRVLDLAKMKEYRLAHPEIKDITELQNVEECYSMQEFPGIVKDVSETGVGIYSSEKIPEDSEVSFKMPTKFGMLECQCTPVRGAVDQDTKYRYFYGCRMISVSKNVVKILMATQREQLSKQRDRD